MGHIFISYSHKDTAYAHKLASALQKKGLEVWIDERLDYGSQWPHEIQKQLDACSAFIVIMSPRSFASEWVQSELQRAKRKLKSSRCCWKGTNPGYQSSRPSTTMCVRGTCQMRSFFQLSNGLLLIG